MNNGDDFNGRATLASLQTEVHTLKGQINNIFDKLESISEALTASRNPNWPILIMGLGVIISLIIGVTGLVYNPLDNRISEVRSDAASERSAISATLKELRENSSEERYALDLMIEKLNDKIVPRTEQEAVSTLLKERIDSLSGRLEETRRQVSELYGPGDKLKDIQQQINDLRAAILSNSRRLPTLEFAPAQ